MNWPDIIYEQAEIEVLLVMRNRNGDYYESNLIPNFAAAITEAANERSDES
jgi:hypothetical protein